MLRAQTPLRVGFAGGGTDIPPFPSLERGAALSAAVNRYAYGTLLAQGRPAPVVDAPDLLRALRLSAGGQRRSAGPAQLTAAVTRRFPRPAGGYQVTVRADARPGDGLGAGAAQVVTMVALLRQHHRLGLGAYETAQLAHDVERLDLGVPGGAQDQYVAALGGFTFLEFDGDQVLATPLDLPAGTVQRLQDSLVLCHLGRPRGWRGAVDEQTRRVRAGCADTLAALRQQRRLAIRMRAALLADRLEEFGALMAEVFSQQQRLCRAANTPRVAEIYGRVRAAGALGGTLTGASGGHLLVYCAPGRRGPVADAAAGQGLSAQQVVFESSGVRTWEVAG